MEQKESKREKLKNILKGKTNPNLTTELSGNNSIANTANLTGEASILQKRMWRVYKNPDSRGIYNITHIRKLQGKLHEEALEAAFQWVIERHPALRTTYEETNDTLIQKVNASGKAALTTIDLANTPNQEAKIADIIAQETNQFFDLEQGPVLRATLIKLGEDQNTLIFIFDHIAFDLWSMMIFCRELKAKYNAIVSNKALHMERSAFTCLDFARNERVQEQEAIDYWAAQLRELPTSISLPTDYPKPEKRSFRGKLDIHKIPANKVSDLRKLSSAHGATLFTALLSVFYILLWRLSGQNDLYLGSILANRNKESENAIGYFANSIILRTKLGKEDTFRNILLSVRKSVLDALSYPRTPIEVIGKQINHSSQTAFPPFLQIAFVVYDIDVSPGEFLGLSEAPCENGLKLAKRDISLFVFPEDNGDLIGYWEYCTDLYSEKTIQDFSNEYARLIEYCSANPDQPVI